MQNTNQSEPTSKIPWHKTPEGKAYKKAYRQTPEFKAKQKAKRQTPEARAKQKARRQAPEYKAYQKAYQQTPEYKAKEKARRQTPEYKAKDRTYRQSAKHKDTRRARKLTPNEKAYQKAYQQTPRSILRRAVLNTFKRIGKNKPTNTLKLLGCEWEYAKAHFESLFKEGMTWENHGEWHIDHVRPVSSFKEDELHLMNHISNLQPLWAHENWEKSDKIL